LEPFLPDPSKRIPKKNSKKIKKIKKNNPGFISSQNGTGEGEKERKNISHSEPLLPNLSWRIPNKIEKKNLKTNPGFISS